MAGKSSQKKLKRLTCLFVFISKLCFLRCKGKKKQSTYSFTKKNADENFYSICFLSLFFLISLKVKGKLRVKTTV